MIAGMPDQEFAALPDDYAFSTADDRAIVAAALSGYNANLSFSTDAQGQLLGPLTAFGEKVLTAGGLRQLMRANTREEPDNFRRFSELMADEFARLSHVIALMRCRERALTFLLERKGLIEAHEFHEELQREVRDGYWAARHEIWIKWTDQVMNEFKRIYPSWLTGRAVDIPRTPPEGYEKII
jgi:hypothetical protein